MLVTLLTLSPSVETQQVEVTAELTISATLLMMSPFDGWYAGGSPDGVVIYEGNNFTNVRYSKNTTSEGVYGNSGLSGNGLTNYTNNIFDQVEFAQLGKKRAEFNLTSIGNTVMTDSYDSDSDGLCDLFEFFTLGTDPGDTDSDGDTLSDGWEAKYNDSLGVNPTVAATDAELYSDTDNDGLNLINEASVNGNPMSNDTDGDGLNDSYEYLLGLSLIANDTDGDGLPDSYEVLNNLNANFADASSDKDGDGWTNLEEFMMDTDPSDPLSYPTEDLGQSLFHWINNNIYDTGITRDALVLFIVLVSIILVALIISFPYQASWWW